MLHAKDLMVGDWVYIEHTEDGIAPYKEVICIKAEDLCRDACIIETHYEPIPLTPEILEKNWFEKQNNYQWKYCDNSCIILISIAPQIEIGGEVIGIPPTNIMLQGALFNIYITGNYNVHELQHALRLCNIKKTIEL